ncbi:DUF1876 domain-containing protein [Phytoactinopolyspora limicola]|uniref:DUF1876 domain-containing protein n=1 Tax=Phytoactinopolyspora limicola TaxID=2715536 RepID=UPI00140B2C48|nr:DUF1876 domain-containing protein [Phytoactinopolyspora limicola]
MTTTKRWTVQIFLSEHDDGTTRAEAQLDTHTGTSIRAVGAAHCNPEDVNVPEIGDELATARALATLGETLLRIAAGDVEASTHEPVSLKR